MKIIEKVLKNKLSSYGFNLDTVSEQLKQLDFDLIENQIVFEAEAENFINIREYHEPSVEIARTLINYNKYYIQSAIIAGEVSLATSPTSINSIIPVVDYSLSSDICIVATTVSLNVEVLIYNPSSNTLAQYGHQTYEEIFGKERNKIAREYYEAFVENGRVGENKVKGILALLLSEYIIDEIAITGANPKIKMYDNVEAYAENITEYRLKYINRKTNRIELAYKPTYIKRLGANVSAGVVSNDPYIKLDSLPKAANFPMNMLSCYWTYGSKNKKEEVAIYIATKLYDGSKTYKEFCENNTRKYDEIAEALLLQFQREIGREVSKEFILSVLKKLNPELLYPSMDVIRDSLDNPADLIEPIRYKFKAICNPEDFEEKLYISIEDNMGKRYKYKLTENVLDDLTRIGNKLEYTGDDGYPVRKQSIADFNMNANTAIIRRETLIDYSKIPGLLGYIYEDMEYLGTDMLPVPSIEVDFYFPTMDRFDVMMYNGTNFEGDIQALENSNRFNSMGNDNTALDVPGTTYAIVRYVNSKGEILKENRINNLFPGTPYVPEIIPIINDIEGREWICATTQYPTTVINSSPDYNVIEIKYTEKYSRVNITFLNREGKKISDDVIETVQAGTIYDLTKKEQYIDEFQNDWKLITVRPQKLLVKDDESKNNLILVYDLEKESVTVKYVSVNGDVLKEPSICEYQVGKIYSVSFEKIIIDENGLGWIYNGKSPIEHLVTADAENIIEARYDVYKLPVVVKYQNEDGLTIANDVRDYLQVGKNYAPKIEKEIVDFNCKKWKYKACDKNDFVISKNENENIIKVIYEPQLVNVSVQLIDESGKRILNPIQKLCQIGDAFTSNSMKEATDNYGKMWVQKDSEKTLIVSENEAENNIIIRYQPLMSTVTVKFFDDERNELIPSKQYQRQAGTMFKPEIIEKLESSDGRKWFINLEKLREIKVKKNVEENIASIFYEKELTDVTIEFVDAYGNSLREKAVVKAQIGSIFNEKMYNKIEDRSGGKWMLESSEPKKMVVKNSNNNFRLIYGEVKAIVIVKHINVNNNTTILDDIITKVKLGGVFVPNIQQKVLDANKLVWKFVGDNNLSIVVKENEQENIVLLQYDEALAKVSVKYQNQSNTKLRADVTYDLQIGKTIDYKKLEQIIDDNGLGWSFESSKASNSIVQENNNEVTNYYSQWKTDVKVVYLNDKNEEIKNSITESLQVGTNFKPTYDDRITDENKLLWNFKELTETEIKVSEKGNLIEAKYVPVMSNVIQKFLSKTGEMIGDNISDSKQVGSVIEISPEFEFVDKKSRKWNFIKIDRNSVQIKEDASQNIVNRFYEPKMSELVVKVYDDNNNEIVDAKKYYAQIGSSYTANVSEIYIDPKTKLGWKLPSKINKTILVNENSKENILSIRYDKYMVKAKDRCVDMEGNIIIPDKEKLIQVGMNYSPKITENLIDDSGKEWLYNQKPEGIFNSSNNTGTIMISENPEQNVAVIKYKPSLASGIIKYQDNLGNVIASREEFKAQIGSEYTPEIKEVIVDIKKNKWTFNPNSKSTIVIDRDPNKNVITLSYEEEKAPIIYKYQDEFKNRLKAPKKVLAQIGSIFTPDVEKIVEDEHGKVWEYKSLSVEKLEVKDSEQDNVIEVTYIPLCLDVLLNMRNRKGELLSKTTVKAQLGCMYKPTLDESIFDDESKMFKLVKCEPEELMIKEVPIGVTENLNVFDVIYEPVYSNLSIIYQDIDGNKLKDDDVIQLQVGTKYTPKLIQFVKDRKGIQWENISKEVDTIRVMENASENIIKMTFELAKAEVMIKFKDMEGNTIKESITFQENIGVEFVPKIDQDILDSKNRKWTFVLAEPVKITVGSINNIINLVYQEKKVPVIIKFQTIDGKKLREDMVVNVQEGVHYVPKKNFAIIYDENEIWKYLEFRPASLLVSDKKAENVIIQVYDNKNETVQEKKTLFNPFANTLTEQEKIEIEKEEMQEKVEENNVEEIVEEFVFEAENLKELSRSIILSEKERLAIIKLNELNKSIVTELANFRDDFNFDKADELVRIINEHMQEEEKTIQNDLADMIANDKTGKKFMKVLEAVAHGTGAYTKMQQRKVILLTDYFINTKISASEQAHYICERGKNNKELLIMKEKIINLKKNTEQFQDIYMDLLYEKAMLDSYYKTRSKAKDEYFENEAERNSLGSEIVIMVTNMLPKQAYNILQKDDKMTLIQENELDAIINLINEQQRKTLEKLIDETRDNKLRKAMTKRLKNIR